MHSAIWWRLLTKMMNYVSQRCRRHRRIHFEYITWKPRKKNHDDNAWGNKRHLPIIMITLLLTNFDFYPSFPIFYSLLENCMNNEKVEKQEHLAQIFIVTFWRISFFFVCWKGSGRAWSFAWWSVFLGEWCIVSVE